MNVPFEQLDSLRQELLGVEDPLVMLQKAVALGGDRTALGTSGQWTGTVMIAMAAHAQLPLRVFTIDTLRLFPETCQFFAMLEDRYHVTIERFKPDAAELQQMVSIHGEHLFFDSKAKQEYCCDVRKVHSNRRALATVDIWITGLRRDQSAYRADTPSVSWVDQVDPDGTVRKILKICPLCDWSEAQLRDWCRDHEVPVHPLLQAEKDGWRYPSLGCIICTTPVGSGEPLRAGRWRWFNSLGTDDKKECGIHIAGLPEQD